MRYLIGANRRRISRWSELGRRRATDVRQSAGPLGTSDDPRAIGDGGPGAGIGTISAFGRSSWRRRGRGRRLGFGRRRRGRARVLTGWRSSIRARRLRRARRGHAMTANDGEDLRNNARMQPRGFIDVDMIDTGIGTDIDIVQRAVEARSLPHIGIVPLRQIDNARDVVAYSERW